MAELANTPAKIAPVAELEYAHGLPARNAEVAKLADASGLGPEGRNPVRVRISPSA